MGTNERAEPLQLTPRERDQIRACQAYAEQFEASGLPGHGLFILVAKLSALVEDAVSRFGYAPDAQPPVKVQRIVLDPNTQTWRDMMTGVKVDLSND